MGRNSCQPGVRMWQMELSEMDGMGGKAWNGLMVECRRLGMFSI